MTTRAYLICAGPRTGSNVLATALRVTDCAGRPFEYFNAPEMNAPWMLKELGLPPDSPAIQNLAERLEQIVRAGTTTNGVFGATVHWWDLAGLLRAIQQIQSTAVPVPGREFDVLRSFFPELRCVWLRRNNMVAQGISHYLAMATGIWSVRDTSNKAEPTDSSNVPFDFSKIDHLVRDAAKQADRWRGFLAGAGDITLPLTYEELAADFPGTIQRVLGFLGVSIPPENLPRPHFRRQSDARSLEWENRYRQEAGLEHSGAG